MHLYLGLSLGLILTVVGLTGAILVFYQELQELTLREMAVVSMPSKSQRKPVGLDDMLAAADLHKPPGSDFVKVYYPRKDDVAYKFLYFVRDPKRADNGDGYYVLVDPYTAEVKGVQLWHPKGRFWERPLVSFIMNLHWCLLLGETGEIIVGVLAVLSLISVLTGLIVWWPLTGNFKQALALKHKAGAARFNFDLHKTVGFYSTLVLLPVLFSGVYFNLPDQVNTLVRQFSALERRHAWNGISAELRSSNPDGRQALAPGQIESVVRQHYPDGKLWMIQPPAKPDDVYLAWQRGIDALSPFVGYRDIAIDPYDGQILRVHEAGTGCAGDVLLGWQWSLHSGHAFGWPGRILVLVAGLACPLLFVTGVLRWLQKLKAKRYNPKSLTVGS